jgi:hypothetical protein
MFIFHFYPLKIHGKGDADGDIAVAAKVEINLEGVGVEQQPERTARMDHREKRWVERKTASASATTNFLNNPTSSRLPAKR